MDVPGWCNFIMVPFIVDFRFLILSFLVFTGHWLVNICFQLEYLRVFHAHNVGLQYLSRYGDLLSKISRYAILFSECQLNSPNWRKFLVLTLQHSVAVRAALCI